MSSNARWRGFKIVVPPTPSREEELVGGLKNALDRGETLAKAQQSFISAGYKPAEVAAAVQKIPTATSQIGRPMVAPSEIPTKPQEAPVGTNPLPVNSAVIPGQQKTLSKKFIIILISIAVIVLIGAAVLGIFWNKIF
ncbi:MAG: hypothetical protein ABIF18_02635 [archaeon]